MKAYRILAALLYPRGTDTSVVITSWEDRQFFLAQLAKQCKITNKEMKANLEYLRQAGFLLSVKHHKEPGRYGKLWSAVRLVMPSNGTNTNSNDR